MTMKGADMVAEVPCAAYQPRCGRGCWCWCAGAQWRVAGLCRALNSVFTLPRFAQFRVGFSRFSGRLAVLLVQVMPPFR